MLNDADWDFTEFQHEFEDIGVETRITASWKPMQQSAYSSKPRPHPSSTAYQWNAQHHKNERPSANVWRTRKCDLNYSVKQLLIII